MFVIFLTREKLAVAPRLVTISSYLEGKEKVVKDDYPGITALMMCFALLNGNGYRTMLH